MYYWIISGFLFCPSPLSLNLGKAPTILNDTNACNTSWILVFSLKILRTSIMSFLEKSDEHVPCTIVLKMEAHYFPTPTISITHQLFAELIPWVFSTIPSFKCIQTIQVGIIRMFEQYQERLSAVVGAKRAKKVVNEALVLMTLGANDFVNNYFLAGSYYSEVSPIHSPWLLSEYRKILIYGDEYSSLLLIFFLTLPSFPLIHVWYVSVYIIICMLLASLKGCLYIR